MTAWSVPREWPGERVFVICGGESVKAQRRIIPQLRGRFIAVKHGVLVRPDADVMFITGEREATISLPLVSQFQGRYIVSRGQRYPQLPEAKRVGRTKDHEHLCEQPTMVAGYDGGTSAINLAYHFAGPTEIVLIGYDMTGGRWFNDDTRYRMPNPSPANFVRHMAPLASFAEDAKRKGVRIVNCSPISKVTCFEKQPLEAFL